MVATHFELIDKFDVSRYINQVREGLSLKFVRKNLGTHHLAREEWLANNTNISKELFLPKRRAIYHNC